MTIISSRGKKKSQNVQYGILGLEKNKKKGRKWAQDHLLKAISVGFWLIAWNVTAIKFFQ